MGKILIMVLLLPILATAQNVTLTWTAPGDDGFVGQATAYDMRVGYSLWDVQNRFDSLFAISGLPLPSVAGTTDSICITGLPCGVDLYFAIKTLDEAFNISEISNIVVKNVPCPDTTCPGRISDLR